MILEKREVDRFTKNGYIKIPDVFSRDLANRILKLVWDELKINPEDPSTWPGSFVTLEKVLKDPPVPEIISQRYLEAVDILCGVDRWAMVRGAGYWPVLFPGFSAGPWHPPERGWHIDGNPVSAIDGDILGLIGLELFSDISSEGGGTAVRIGSHHYVARILADVQTNGKSAREVLNQMNAATKHLPVMELTGNAGDLCLLHPFTLHATSMNCSDRIRVIAVKVVEWKDRLRLNRENSLEYSPVELAILQGLGQWRKD